MDLITFIKKEEPVEYILTAEDSGNVKEQALTKEIKVCFHYKFDVMIY